MERLSQMAKEHLSHVAKGVSVYEPLDFSEQSDVVRQVERAVSEMKGHVSLIIFDSATSFYRLCTDEYSDTERRRELGVQLSILHRLARTYSLAVLITNQVYTDVATGNLLPIGGVAIEHLSKAVIKLERLEGAGRRAIIKKHRSRPEGEYCEFTITADGYRQRQITRTLTDGTNNLGPQYLQPQLLEGRGAVRGMITRNGTPEPGATVLSGTARATSKVDGSYALYNIEAGERTITAISGDGQATGVTTVSVAIGTTRNGVDIALSLTPPPPPSL